MCPMPPSLTTRVLLPAAAVVAAFIAGQQEPKPAPQPPASLARPALHPFEGVYELRRRVAAGAVDPQPGSGWLAITSRHLFVSLAAPGPDPDLPLLRSGVRTWTAQGDTLQTVVRLGWYTDGDGQVHVEKAGTLETRRLERLRGLVRLHQSENTYLEFERVE